MATVSAPLSVGACVSDARATWNESFSFDETTEDLLCDVVVTLTLTLTWALCWLCANESQLSIKMI